MSAVTEAPVVLTRPDPRSLPGETGMVERPRRRFMPFDPWHLFLAPLAVVMLLPLMWMVVTSLETQAQTFHFPPILWPGTLRFENYANVIRESEFGTWFWNTTVVTVTIVLSNLVLCTLAAYAFARIRFLGRGVIYFVLLATLMVPLQVVLIPTFLIVKDLGLLDRLGALIVPHLASVFGIFMLTQFFRTLPIELEEAARIDGASRLSILRAHRRPALAAGARDARGDPVHVDVERVPLAARDDPDEPERVHAPARTRDLPGGAPVAVALRRGGQHHVDGADPRALPLAQRYFVRGIATQGLKG